MKKLLNIIKNNITFIIFLVVTYFILSFELLYYIEAHLGLINLKDRYEIKDSYQVKGSINMTYVKEYKATLETFLLNVVKIL